MSGRTLYSVKFLLLASDFSTPLAPRSAQCGDMSVPEPPPPDGVLPGPSDSLEAGEPTPGTAVLGATAHRGRDRVGGTPAQATLLPRAPWQGNRGPTGKRIVGCGLG